MRYYNFTHPHHKTTSSFNKNTRCETPFKKTHTPPVSRNAKNAFFNPHVGTDLGQTLETPNTYGSDLFEKEGQTWDRPSLPPLCHISVEHDIMVGYEKKTKRTRSGFVEAVHTLRNNRDRQKLKLHPIQRRDCHG